MLQKIYRSDERGKGEYSWLHTRYSFSFGEYFDRSRMGFGSLRVINDDIIEPGAGFDTHSHADMEIITIVTRGAVAHKDSMNNSGVVPAGDVQVMSAGSGVEHSEYNASKTEKLELFQIWIESRSSGVVPRYAQKSFRSGEKKNAVQLLVAPDTSDVKDALTIHQDAFISRAIVDAKKSVSYSCKSDKNGLYIFVVDGDVEINDAKFHRRDALEISGASDIILNAVENCEILLIEVPLSL